MDNDYTHTTHKHTERSSEKHWTFSNDQQTQQQTTERPSETSADTCEALSWQLCKTSMSSIHNTLGITWQNNIRIPWKIKHIRKHTDMKEWKSCMRITAGVEPITPVWLATTQPLEICNLTTQPTKQHGFFIQHAHNIQLSIIYLQLSFISTSMLFYLDFFKAFSQSVFPDFKIYEYFLKCLYVYKIPFPLSKKIF